MEITCGLFLYDLSRQKFLICHATRTSASQWSIPKGLKEENEESITAALRELEEETGVFLKEKDLVAVYPFERTKYKDRKKYLDSFLVIVRSAPDTSAMKCSSLVNGKFPEIDKFEWVDVRTLEKKVHYTQAAHVPQIASIVKNLYQAER